MTNERARWPACDPPLSSREREVIHYAAQGMTNWEVASALSVSINTVKSHVRAAYRKLGVTDRRAALSIVYGEAALCVRPFPEFAPLTQRQREVLACVAAGMRNREIADTLYISIATVRSHLFRASRQLGAHTRRDAVIAASSYDSQENTALAATA